MIKCLAQGHKCHGWDSNHILLLTPELESGIKARPLGHDTPRFHVNNRDESLNKLLKMV